MKKIYICVAGTHASYEHNLKIINFKLWDLGPQKSET